MDAPKRPLPYLLAVIAVALFAVDALVIYLGVDHDGASYFIALSSAVGLQCVCAILAIVIAAVDRAKRHAAAVDVSVIVVSVGTLVGAGVVWAIGAVLLAMSGGPRGGFMGGG
jgi:hypothetical protein